MPHDKTIKKVSLLFSVLFGIGFVLPAQAAILYIDPANSQVNRGETFSVNITIDTEGECVNAIEGSLKFSNELLQAVNVSTGSSIILLWPISPEISQTAGTINFIGGIPGGYCGKISNDPGESDIIAKLIFRADPDKISSNPAKVNFLPGTQVLLHDGQGTAAKLITKGAELIISGEETSSENQWQEELKKDKTPPEPFKIEIVQVPQIFEGKYFITFLTADKQTGIDYYEVRESPQWLSFKGAKWLKTNGPPYLLQDQTLSRIIEVRAVDKAGNERIERIVPEHRYGWRDWLPWATLIIIAIVGWLIAKFRRKDEVQH